MAAQASTPGQGMLSFDAAPAAVSMRSGGIVERLLRAQDVQADWRPTLDRFWAGATGRQLLAHLAAREAAGASVFPPDPLRALAATSLRSVRVVILGQDPYHGAGQAEGLAFSVAPGVRVPPSLRNVFKELQRDLGLPAPSHGSLWHWARRGVLLLNTSLTVEEGMAGSHARHGWEELTDALIEQVAAHCSPCVYLLWGNHAQAKSLLIERTALAHGCEVLLLAANHPSPLSALRPPMPFIGSGHFGQAVRWLGQRGHVMDWAPVAELDGLHDSF